jgi:Flp pilus assembly protein TadG
MPGLVFHRLARLGHRCAGSAAGRLRLLLRDEAAVTAVQFALVGPMLLMLTIGTFDMVRLVWAQHTIEHAAREAARYAVVRGSRSPQPASEAAIAEHALSRAVGLKPGDLAVTVTWAPDNRPGATVTVQVASPFTFVVSGLLKLHGPTLTSSTTMTVLQ